MRQYVRRLKIKGERLKIENYTLFTKHYTSRHRPLFQECTEVVDIAIRHMDDFISDVDAIVTIYFLYLVQGNDVGTMYAHEV